MRTIRVPVAPRASSWARAAGTTSSGSPESMRTAPGPVAPNSRATSTAVRIPSAMS